MLILNRKKKSTEYDKINNKKLTNYNRKNYLLIQCLIFNTIEINLTLTSEKQLKYLKNQSVRCYFRNFSLQLGT